MALTDINVGGSAANVGPNSILYQLVAQYNALAANMETLMEKMDADAGITDVNYESTVGLTKRITINGVAPTAG